MISFKNDYSVIAHPLIIKRLDELKDEVNDGYGEDIHTKNAVKLIQEKIKRDSDIYFLAGGTVTNMISIASFLRPHEAVIAADSGHINVHETGAIEGTGHKIITIKNNNGKISAKEILEVLKGYPDYHMVKPKLVFISNSTELGTIYQKAELLEIKKVCEENNLYLYLDGARLSVALDKSDISLADYAKYTDAFYIGGTKIGSYFGEALVINNKALASDFKYLIKHYGGMLAKGFLPAIAFEVLFEDDLYFKLGHDQNEKADYLKNELSKIGVKFASDSKTNQIFPIFKKSIVEMLSKEFIFEKWGEYDKDSEVIRFVLSFQNKISDIDYLVSKIKEVL